MLLLSSPRHLLAFTRLHIVTAAVSIWYASWRHAAIVAAVAMLLSVKSAIALLLHRSGDIAYCYAEEERWYSALLFTKIYAELSSPLGEVARLRCHMPCHIVMPKRYAFAVTMVSIAIYAAADAFRQQEQRRRYIIFRCWARLPLCHGEDIAFIRYYFVAAMPLLLYTPLLLCCCCRRRWLPYTYAIPRYVTLRCCCHYSYYRYLIAEKECCWWHYVYIRLLADTPFIEMHMLLFIAALRDIIYWYYYRYDIYYHRLLILRYYFHSLFFTPPPLRHCRYGATYALMPLLLLLYEQDAAIHPPTRALLLRVTSTYAPASFHYYYTYERWYIITAEDIFAAVRHYAAITPALPRRAAVAIYIAKRRCLCRGYCRALRHIIHAIIEMLVILFIDTLFIIARYVVAG